MAAYAAGLGALSVLRHHAFSTGRFDLGNMVQAVWTTAHGHPLAVTDLRGEQISRLGAHVDPILVLLAARCRSSGSRASTSGPSAPRSGWRSPTSSTRRCSG
jgi:hypothetical protein